MYCPYTCPILGRLFTSGTLPSNLLCFSNLHGYFHFCHLADILPQTPDILLPSETTGQPTKHLTR